MIKNPEQNTPSNHRQEKLMWKYSNHLIELLKYSDIGTIAEMDENSWQNKLMQIKSSIDDIVNEIEKKLDTFDIDKLFRKIEIRLAKMIIKVRQLISKQTKINNPEEIKSYKETEKRLEEIKEYIQQCKEKEENRTLPSLQEVITSVQEDTLDETDVRQIHRLFAAIEKFHNDTDTNPEFREKLHNDLEEFWIQISKSENDERKTVGYFLKMAREDPDDWGDISEYKTKNPKERDAFQKAAVNITRKESIGIQKFRGLFNTAAEKHRAPIVACFVDPKDLQSAIKDEAIEQDLAHCVLEGIRRAMIMKLQKKILRVRSYQKTEIVEILSQTNEKGEKALKKVFLYFVDKFGYNPKALS